MSSVFFFFTVVYLFTSTLDVCGSSIQIYHCASQSIVFNATSSISYSSSLPLPPAAQVLLLLYLHLLFSSRKAPANRTGKPNSPSFHINKPVPSLSPPLSVCLKSFSPSFLFVLILSNSFSPLKFFGLSLPYSLPLSLSVSSAGG